MTGSAGADANVVGMDRRSGGLTRRELLRRGSLGAGALVMGPRLLGLRGATGAAVKSGGTLKFGISAYPPSFNPFLQTGSAAYNIAWCVYRGLVGFDPQGGFQPEIAESWQLSSDGRTMTFKLRPNAVFHNGDPVTADDVKFSIDYMRDAANAAYLYSAMSVISDVTVVDPQTVKFTLPTPDAALLDVLAEPVAPIVSQKALQANPTNFVGAGPFTYTTQESGTKVVVTKFDKFYKKGKPKLNSIDFTVYADDNLRATALQSGAVDMIDYVQWQSLGSVKGNPKLKLAGTGTGALMYLVFNLTRAPFNNPQVREALAWGINRKNIVNTAFFGSGAPANGAPVPTQNPYYDKATGDVWSYNPKKAKSLLAQAGYPNGFSATLLSTSQYGMHKDTAISVQNDLTKLGLKISLSLPDWATRVSLGGSGNYDFAVQGAGGPYNDPDYLTAFLVGGTNQLRSAGNTDPQFATLLTNARSTTSKATRKAAYQQVEKLFVDQVPLLPLTWRSQYYGLNKSVTGFKPLPGFLLFYSCYTFEDVSLSQS